MIDIIYIVVQRFSETSHYKCWKVGKTPSVHYVSIISSKESSMELFFFKGRSHFFLSFSIQTIKLFLLWTCKSRFVFVTTSCFFPIKQRKPNRLYQIDFTYFEFHIYGKQNSYTVNHLKIILCCHKKLQANARCLTCFLALWLHPLKKNWPS